MSRAVMQPIALALHLDDLGMCEEAIEDRGRRRDVAQELPPVLRGTIECSAYCYAELTDDTQAKPSFLPEDQHTL